MIHRFVQLLGMIALSSATLQGSSFSFQGLFTSDDQIQFFNFAIASNSTVTIRNFGYGGGTNQAGTVIPAGGFDNLITLYQSDGTQIGSFDDDACVHGTLPNHGGCLDAYYSNTLQAGAYILALTVSGNLPNGDLADGFSQAGQGNFTENDCSPPHAFCSFGGFPENGNWALDILTVTSASQVSAVPEPASLALGLTGIGLIGIIYRRHSSRAHIETTSGAKQ